MVYFNIVMEQFISLNYEIVIYQMRFTKWFFLFFT